jgi:hypothetical protein
VGVNVFVAVSVAVGVLVAVAVGVTVGVDVLVGVEVTVEVLLGVDVGVDVHKVAVAVALDAITAFSVSDARIIATCVLVEIALCVCVATRLAVSRFEFKNAIRMPITISAKQPNPTDRSDFF